MQATFKLDEGVSLKGYTVLLPSVCVGNAAQLAIDLIISSLEMQKVATVWHPSIIPVIGPRAFQHPTAADGSDQASHITTACELFRSDADQLACFQLRSPLVNGPPLTAFFADLIAFLQRQQINDLLILTGSFAHEQHSIGAPKFVYVCDEQFRAQHAKPLANNGWTEWDRTTNVIHGGGFALKLYKQIDGALPTCVLFKYISEGDNRCDAVDLMRQSSRLIERMASRVADEGQGAEIRVPVSWKAMFGNDASERAKLY